MNNKMVLVGCVKAGYEIARELLQSGIRFDYIVTINCKKANDMAVAGYVDFTPLSQHYNIPIYYAEKYSLKSERDLSFFEEHKFDLLIQGGWQRLFPDTILSTLSIGAIGVHGSPDFLPKGRGRSPLNWSIINNSKRFILHYFIIKPGIDDGDVFHYEIFDINEWDDIETLYIKNTLVTIQTLQKFIPLLLAEGAYHLIPQQGTPSYYEKRSKEDGRIDWSKSVIEIYNLIRAVTIPYPGSFTTLHGVELTIWKAFPFSYTIDAMKYKYGEIIFVSENRNLIVKCGDGLLIIKQWALTTEEIKIERGSFLV